MLNVKKDKYDTTDYSKLADTIKDINEYAIGLHHRLVAATNLLKKDSEKIDIHEINKLLNDYPAIYSWACIENRLVAQKIMILEETYDDIMRSYFHEYITKMPEKSTQKAIDAAIYSDHKAEIDALKYNIRDMKTKSDILKDLVNVWESASHTLQALSKQVSLELELSKLKMRGV